MPRVGKPGGIQCINNPVYTLWHGWRRQQKNKKGARQLANARLFKRGARAPRIRIKVDPPRALFSLPPGPLHSGLFVSMCTTTIYIYFIIDSSAKIYFSTAVTTGGKWGARFKRGGRRDSSLS